MTPTELRDTLRRLGLSQIEAARLLGVDPSAVRRWLTDKDSRRSIPGPAVAFLRLLDDCPAALKHVRRSG